MQYSQLGETGVFVSRICLGAMTFGGADNAAGNAIGRLTQPETATMVGTALDAGVNFIDTADVYGAGGSERVLGEALKGKREQVVLATKLHARVGPGANQVGQSRLHIMQALEASLKRLQTDHIDLYQVHGFDPFTPQDEVLRAMEDIVRQGKVRYIGCSNYAGWQLAKAMGIAERDRLTKFVSVQSFYSLACRDIEDELIPAAADSRTGLLCWSPLAGGLLSGKFDREGAADKAARRALIEFPPLDRDKAYDIIDVLKRVAERHRASVAQIALAWLLAKPAVTSVIVGARRVEQLVDNLASVDIALSAADLAELDEVSQQPARYPGWIATYNAQGRLPEGYPLRVPSWVLGQKPV